MSRNFQLRSVAALLLWGLAFLASGELNRPVWAEEAEQPEPMLTDKQLVENLGAEAYLVRENAEAEILKRGKEILPLLDEARRSPDPEVRLRAGSLYLRLSERVRKENFEQFLDMADNIDLPGWKRFQERHGDTRDTRKLFVRMLKSEWALMTTMESQPHLVDYLLFQRANKLREELYGPSHIPITEGSTAAMLHATSYPQIRVSEPAMDEIKFLLADQQFIESLQDPQHSGPMLSIFNQWLKSNLKSRRFTEEMQYIVLMTCLREGIESGKILAKEMLVGEPANNFGRISTINTTQVKMYAMLAIAKLGNQDDIPFVKKYLDNTTDVLLPSVQGDQFNTQLRDVALVAVIHLSGEDPKEYGFPRISPDPNFLYNIRTVGFSSDEQRKKAFDHWYQRWDDVQKKEPAGK